jgi:hypothetical protein
MEQSGWGLSTGPRSRIERQGIHRRDATASSVAEQCHSPKNPAERHLGSVDACPALDLCLPSAVGVRRVPGRTEPISRSARQKVERCNASVVSSQGCDDGIELACRIENADFDQISPLAGSSGVGFDRRAPEHHRINDMDYEFIVPVPARPGGATWVFYESVTHPQHTTKVKEIVELIDPDPPRATPECGSGFRTSMRTMAFTRAPSSSRGTRLINPAPITASRRRTRHSRQYSTAVMALPRGNGRCGLTSPGIGSILPG